MPGGAQGEDTMLNINKNKHYQLLSGRVPAQPDADEKADKMRQGGDGETGDQSQVTKYTFTREA